MLIIAADECAALIVFNSLDYLGDVDVAFSEESF
jgi:hypothetical protein